MLNAMHTCACMCLTVCRSLVHCNRDAAGRIIKPAPFQTRLTPGTVARVEPNRRWFGEFHSVERIVNVLVSAMLELVISVVYYDFCCQTLFIVIINDLLLKDTHQKRM